MLKSVQIEINTPKRREERDRNMSKFSGFEFIPS